MGEGSPYTEKKTSWKDSEEYNILASSESISSCIQLLPRQTANCSTLTGAVGYSVRIFEATVWIASVFNMISLYIF